MVSLPEPRAVKAALHPGIVEHVPIPPILAPLLALAAGRQPPHCVRAQAHVTGGADRFPLLAPKLDRAVVDGGLEPDCILRSRRDVPRRDLDPVSQQEGREGTDAEAAGAQDPGLALRLEGAA